MKVLYGVQGTGNGHISRANAMCEAFRAYPEIDVTWLLSGRERAKGCGIIDNFNWRAGLTFVTGDGGIRKFATLRKNSLLQFWRDVNSLDLGPYDLIVSDYEPVVCHAARRRGVPVVGISHLYAFDYDVPLRGGNPFSRMVLRKFAPVTQAMGLHWFHFGQPILPPIVDFHEVPDHAPPVRNRILVYLPWENPARVQALLAPFTDYEFYIYHPDFTDADEGHLHRRAISRAGFKQNLFAAWGVIANCGFELLSECLYLGKHILTKPLAGQMEQHSNAAALEQLGYASTMLTLDSHKVVAWLKHDDAPVRLEFPDVAAELARWIAGGRVETADALAARLWRETLVHRAGARAACAA